MVDYGVTDAGFVLKRLTEIQTEIETIIREVFGNGINLLPTESLGQIVGILSEREALLWEKIQDVYDSQSPTNASGVSLDDAMTYTGITRLAATKGTGVVTAYGTLGTIVTQGSIISVDGNPDARFVTLADYTLAAGTDEIQDIDFGTVPDAGDWTLIFDGEETGTMAYNDNAAAVQAALNALPNLSAVTVSGNYTSGFTVTFAGADGSIDQPMLQMGTNNLETASVAVSVTIVETTAGVLPNVDMNVEAETAGLINAYAETLTVIETPIAGWDSASNALDIDPGTDIETDAEAKLRREQTLATPGVGTPDAIRSKILALDDVDACKVFENTGNTVDGSGRDPHSFEAVVLGGLDQDIVDTIWANKPLGIATFGSTSGTAVDDSGTNQTVNFSRPTEIDIYIIVNLTTDSNYPIGGDAAVEAAIVAYAAANYSIGDDVITVRFFTDINAIAGILEIEILIGTAPAPTLPDNITIADDEIASFDTANITVNS